MLIVKKSALLHIESRRLLCARTKGLDIFYNAGGKPEIGETAEQALNRKVWEEIRVRIIKETVIHASTFKTPFTDDFEKYVEIEAYFAEFAGVPTPQNKIVEFAWFTTNDTDELPLAGHHILKFLADKNLID